MNFRAYIVKTETTDSGEVNGKEHTSDAELGVDLPTAVQESPAIIGPALFSPKSSRPNSQLGSVKCISSIFEDGQKVS